MRTLTMNDGLSIPVLGYGTWRISDDDAPTAVREAIGTGFRHIDTAMIYLNESGVGRGIRESGIPRDTLFVTTKLWHTEQSDPESALTASLDRLGLEYVDLYLIHWPVPSLGLYAQAWESMIRLRERGLTRSIGVSNFYAQTLDDLASSGVVPAVNQVEIHPSHANRDTIHANTARGIVSESYSPLGRTEDMRNPLIKSVAARLGASPAQVIIAWHLAKNLVAIPKSVSVSRMRENFEARDLLLTDSDIAAIDSVDAGKRIGADPTTFVG